MVSKASVGCFLIVQFIYFCHYLMTHYLATIFVLVFFLHLWQYLPDICNRNFKFTDVCIFILFLCTQIIGAVSEIFITWQPCFFSWHFYVNTCQNICNRNIYINNSQVKWDLSCRDTQVYITKCPEMAECPPRKTCGNLKI